MSTTRREFLQTSLGAGAAFTFGAPLACANLLQPKAAAKSLRILILGGTGFLGPHIVECAVARGHTVTLFNRGRTNPHLFPDLEKIHGDRTKDLSPLEGREWDACVDTSGYFPRVVRMSAELLADHVKHYTFISSVSVYAGASEHGLDETDTIATIDDPTVEQITGETYGPLKALCEQAAEAAMPGRVANIRPGLIVGPGDGSDRFTYWPVRVARGGETLAPNSPDDIVQIIDVRDLAEWIVHNIENNITGEFNAVGPDEPLTIGALLSACKRAAGSDANFTWVPTEFLAQHNVQPWSELTVWLPAEGDYTGFHTRSNAKAIKAGLKFRDTETICRDTLDWWNTLPEERRAQPRAGLAPEKEQQVLTAWHAREATE